MKIGQRFTGILKDGDEEVKGIVIGRAGKVGKGRKGKYKDRYNV